MTAAIEIGGLSFLLLGVGLAEANYRRADQRNQA